MAPSRSPSTGIDPVHRLLLSATIVVALAACAAGAPPAADPGPTSSTTTSEGSPEGSPAAVSAAALAPDPSCPDALSTTHAIDRVAGFDRYATAACASRAAFPAPAPGTVVVARGDDSGGWPDALAGTVLADAVSGPILLTEPGRLPDATSDELGRLRPQTVLVLGGEKAVTDAVLDEIRSAVPGATVRRVAGPDRFATAAAVSREAGATQKAFVVNGFRPADALVAGAPAARADAALLLVSGDDVPGATAQALEGVGEVTIVGGYGVVSDAVEDRLRSLVPTVRRVSGGNRAETAASVSRAFAAPDGRLYLANGGDRSLVDAIGAGWSSARDGGGAVLYAERDAPGHGADRYLRLGGLDGDAAIRLVGGDAVLGPPLVEVLQQRIDEAAAGGPPAQMRAMWVHLFDGTLKSGPTIDRMLDTAAAANLNTVIVEVVRRHDAYYTSSVLPRTPDPTMPADLDLLARLVPAAHDRGLEVHAWAPAMPAWHPAYTGLVLPFWRDHGKGSADPWVSVNANGEQGEYFDPGVPAVQDHVVAMYREIAERYPIDAIHLDYLRYSESRCTYGGRSNIVGCWGYHPAALSRFQAETGGPSWPDPWDAGWSDWRREQTRDLAQRITDAVHAARPGTAVTLAGISQGDPPASTTDYTNTKTWNGVFQAWPDWVRDGVIDGVFPMNYFDDSRYPHWYDGWVAFESHLADQCRAARPTCVVAVGQAAYLNTVAESVDQLSQALGATHGAVIYSYQGDSIGSEDNDPTWQQGLLLGGLSSGLFATPAPAPPLR